MDILSVALKVGLICLLVLVAISDIKTRIIPCEMLFVAALMGLVLMVVEQCGLRNILIQVSTALALFICLLTISVVYERCTHRMSMGGGDIKLFALCSLVVGPSLSVPMILLSSVLGLVMAVVIPRYRIVFPFAPAIVASTCLFLMVKWLS